MLKRSSIFLGGGVVRESHVTSLGQGLPHYGKHVLGVASQLLRLGDTFHRHRPADDVMRMPRVLPLNNKRAVILDNCFIAPSASVIGDVRVGRKNYIGYNTVVRAEEGQTIYLGESCNIQEKAIVTGSTSVGKWSTIEPMAIVESADIASCSFVGTNAVVMKGAKIESNAMLCAGAVLQAGATVPSGEIWAGNPATPIGTLTEDEKHYIVVAAKHQVLLNVYHSDSWEQPFEAIDHMRIVREMWATKTEKQKLIRARPLYVKEPPAKREKSRSTTPYETAQRRGKAPAWERASMSTSIGSSGLANDFGVA